jgi:uncharacterized membrane protein
MVDTTPTPPLVSWTERLENNRVLDTPVRLVQPLVDALLADKRRADALHGMWLGHSVHPLLVMVPIGTWTSATVLDLVGGRDSRSAAQRLVATGLLAAGPSAITGWAEWGPIEQREKRVGLVHAVSNVTAVGLFAASWKSRSRGRHLRGVALGLAGHAAVGVGGYLGGHLTEARKVGSRHPRFDDQVDDGLGGRAAGAPISD